ncbi:MAG: hypothetical protein KDC44_11510, partial [Phaeodactylibacter sp.]|nr:hypothetical protein [Phaeodactylibacter sp.]
MVRTPHSSPYLSLLSNQTSFRFLVLLLVMGASLPLRAQVGNPTENFDLAYDFDYIKENTSKTGEGTLILNVTFRPEGTSGIFLSDKTGIRVTGLRQKKAEFIFRIKEVRVKGISDRKLNFQLPDACHRISGPVKAPA